MMPPAVPSHTETLLRRLILSLFAFGLLGVATELIALGHYEDSWQFVPLVVIGLALTGIAWQVFSPSAASIRALRGIALFLIVSGGIGMVLHYRGNMEFQLEMNPNMKGWELFTRILHAKAPPALAPGVMAQLGLLGLIYGFRHPATRRASEPTGGQ